MFFQYRDVSVDGLFADFCFFADFFFGLRLQFYEAAMIFASELSCVFLLGLDSVGLPGVFSMMSPHMCQSWQ